MSDDVTVVDLICGYCGAKMGERMPGKLSRELRLNPEECYKCGTKIVPQERPQNSV